MTNMLHPPLRQRHRLEMLSPIVLLWELLKEIDKITKEPVTDKELANTKAKYVGRFVLALERPETIARYALDMETENLPKDFYKNYWNVSTVLPLTMYSKLPKIF